MKKAVISGVVTVLVLGLGYMGGIGYYAEKFTPNTSYGPVQIGNLTLAEAKDEIKKVVEKKSVVLTENGKEIGKIALADLGLEVESEAILEATFKSQDPTQWVMGFVDGTEVKKVFADQVTVDEATLVDVLATNNIQNENREEAVNAQILYTDEKGYYVEPGTKGNQIDYQKLTQEIVNSLENNSPSVALESAYADPIVNEESETIKTTMDYINQVLDTKIILQIAGEEITIPRELIQQWIHFDAQNNLIIDGTMVADYLYGLDEKYATAGKTREFESTLQGTVSVPPGILGWNIDIETETANIISDIQKGEDVTRKVAVYGVGTHLGEEDEIGSTYVEIDLANQMMYLYVEGEVIVATNIVSGKVGAETVPGANAVIEMLKDTDLVGFNQFLNKKYKVPVSYWIRFDDKDQGIHDASWQWSFGGDTYQDSGSLGCINTPYDQVAIIYEYVEYGTPVIVF